MRKEPDAKTHLGPLAFFRKGFDEVYAPPCSTAKAVACHGGSEVVSLWLERGGAEVRWNYSKPASAVSSELPIRWRLQRLLQPLWPLAPLLPSALPLLGIALGEVALVAKSGLLLLLSILSGICLQTRQPYSLSLQN